MWIVQRLCRLDRACNIVVTAIRLKSRVNKVHPITETIFKTRNSFHTSCTSPFTLLQGKSQYEYDPNTDSFRPKDQVSYINTPKSSKEGKQSNASAFLKRFIRNVFLLTGGVVWIGALFVSLFVDVKEEDLEHRIRDLDDEVRLLAFYDVGRFTSDLAKMMSKDKSLSDILDFHSFASCKQEAFLNVIRWIQDQETIKDTLGSPVHLCGFRAAGKISEMIQCFQHLAEHGIKNHLKEIENKNLWKAECILEGSKGVALVTLAFERTNKHSEWVLTKISVALLEPDRNTVFERESVLPDGVAMVMS